LTRPDEILGRMMGGLLPYILIIFCFLGCMYPALDLGAGEKERGTMETLLTAPASRIEIVLGSLVS
jgi:sodium transport system permease protein